MTKRLFLRALRFRISELPEREIEERLNFYSEIIDDRIEEGYTEHQAVADVGELDDIAAQIKADAMPQGETFSAENPKEKKQGTKPPRESSGDGVALRIILLVLGSPIWLSLTVAIVAVMISVLASAWAVLVSLFAVCASLGGGALFFVGSSVFAQGVELAARIFSIGSAFLSAGLSVLLFFAAKSMARGCIGLSKWVLTALLSIFKSIFSLLVGKKG